MKWAWGAWVDEYLVCSHGGSGQRGTHVLTPSASGTRPFCRDQAGWVYRHKSMVGKTYRWRLGHGEPLTPSIYRCLLWGRASLVAKMVKNPSTMQETQVQPLGGEDALKKGMPTHSRYLAWRIPWTEETGGLQSMGSPKVRHK